jgi:hypothetical protein
MKDSIPRYILLDMATIISKNNTESMVDSVAELKTGGESSNNTAVDVHTGTDIHTTPKSAKKNSRRKSPRTSSTPLLSGKRTRTPTELFCPGSITSSERSPKRPYRRRPPKKPKQTPKEVMLEAEKKYLSLKATSCEDPSNKELRLSVDVAEREFYNLVVSLSLRQNARTKWKGWELGYAKMCSLSDIGDEYAKTPRKLFHFPTIMRSNYSNIVSLCYFLGGKIDEVVLKAQQPKWVVCKLCWNNPSIPIKKSFVSLVNNNYSNIWQHIKSKHDAKEYPELISDSKSKDTNVSSLTGDASFSKKTIGTQQLITNTFHQSTPDEALSYLYRFFNEANVAIRQASNDNLRKYTDYLIDNAHSLRGKKASILFSKFKYKKYEINDFTSFVQILKYLVNIARSYYKDTLQTNIPFIIVAHDGWDSKDHDILGVSVHFICPVLWIPVNLAVGLKRVFNKTAANMHSEIMNILSR